MFYDLNIPWSPDDRNLSRTLAFAHELGYNVVALNHTISGKLPSDLTCPIPNPLPPRIQQEIPPKLTILRRITLVLTDSHPNARLAQLAKEYDILAVRPIDEASLKVACGTLDCDIISLDLTQRFPFFFRHQMVNEAVKLGKRFEISYSGGVLGDASSARRQMISNATQLIRATRGRGIVVSSGGGPGGLGGGGIGLRGPWDVVNLCAVWGLGQERGVEAVGKEGRGIVVRAGLKRTGYRGVVDVVYGGEKPEKVDGQDGTVSKGKQKAKAGKGQGPRQDDTESQAQGQHQDQSKGHEGQKRSADAVEGNGDGEVQLSKRKRRRMAHEARKKGQAETNEIPAQGDAGAGG